MNSIIAITALIIQIQDNRPNIDPDYATAIATINHKMCKKYNVDCRLVTAIQRQESTYRLNAVNPKGDKGIMQVSAWNIKKRKLNAQRLLTDLEYSIEQGVRILSEFKYWYKDKELDWWVRYNIGTGKRGPKLNKIAEKYKKSVLRFFPKQQRKIVKLLNKK